MAFISRIRITRCLNLGGLRLLSTESAGNGDLREEQKANPEQDDKDEELKNELLGLALKHVNAKGWNHNAIKAGAEELGLSDEVSNVFSEYDLVKYFLQKNNEDLEVYLSTNKTNLQEAMQWKLQNITPYAPKLNEALAYATQPENLPDSIKMLQNFADIIAHYSLQDKSTDLSWYSKRVGIASIYVATELHLLQDKSQNYEDTSKFLQRRLKEFSDVQQGSILPFANALPEVFSIGLTTALNILGRNQKR